MLRLRLGPATGARGRRTRDRRSAGRRRLIGALPLRRAQRARARRLQLRRMPRLPGARAGGRLAARASRPGRRGVRGGPPTATSGEALAIPGAPYAIALERDGTVGAKGTFNNLAQLESILATAERRRRERPRVGGARCLSPAGRRTGPDRPGPRGPRRQLVAARVPRPGRHRDGGGHGGRGGREARSSRARRTPTISAATPTRPIPAPIRPGRTLPRIDRAGYPLEPASGKPIDNLGRPHQRAGASPSMTRQGAARPRRPAAAAGAADEGLPGGGQREASGSRPTSTAAGIAAAAVRSASSSTAARNTTSGSTATPPSRATASAGRKVFCVLYFDTRVPC